jgi:hypothetical protein
MPAAVISRKVNGIAVTTLDFQASRMRPVYTSTFSTTARARRAVRGALGFDASWVAYEALNIFVIVFTLLFNRVWVVDLFFENLWRLDLELFVEYCRELRNCNAVYTEPLDELFATLLTVFTNKDRAVNIL